MNTQVDMTPGSLLTVHQDGEHPNIEIIENDEKEKEKHQSSLLFGVDDIPPPHYTMLLGLQQYLTMFSSSMSIPYLLAPAMCIADDSPARAYIISTLLFVAGIVTFMQTTFGIRLPIIQGGTFAFLIPTFGILNLPQWKCPILNETLSNDTTWHEQPDIDEIWMSRMREIQGAIAVSAVFQVLLGFTGAIGIMLRYVTPLTIAPTITLVGLSLFSEAAHLASGNWAVAIGTTVLLIALSQYMDKIQIPLPFYKRRSGCTVTRLQLFALFPVLFTILTMWVICAILTSYDIFPAGSPARTDQKIKILQNSPWFRVPYPGQWGLPTVSTAGVFGMIAGVIASAIESIGDYYACARLSGAPPPPPHAINRGIMVEGIGCIIAGIFGSGNGTTSYSENIAIIGITKVASRRVIQMAAVYMAAFAVITKFGALFVSMPAPIVGGIFLVTFGMITAVGLCNVQFIDLNSTRNIFVLGFSIFAGISISKWMASNRDAIQTGSDFADQLLTVILSTSMLIGGVLGFVLDNTIPGSDEERGVLQWREITSTKQGKAESSSFDFPFGMNFIKKCKIFNYFPVCPTFDMANCNAQLSSLLSCHTKKPTEKQDVNGTDNPNFELTQVD